MKKTYGASILHGKKSIIIFLCINGMPDKMHPHLQSMIFEAQVEYLSSRQCDNGNVVRIDPIHGEKVIVALNAGSICLSGLVGH